MHGNIPKSTQGVWYRETYYRLCESHTRDQGCVLEVGCALKQHPCLLEEKGGDISMRDSPSFL